MSASDEKCLLSELKSSCSTDVAGELWLGGDDRRNLLENPPKPDDLAVLLAAPEDELVSLGAAAAWGGLVGWFEALALLLPLTSSLLLTTRFNLDPSINL